MTLFCKAQKSYFCIEVKLLIFEIDEASNFYEDRESHVNKVDFLGLEISNSEKSTLK